MGEGSQKRGHYSRGIGLRSFRPKIPPEISARGVFVGRRFTVKAHPALFEEEGVGGEGRGEGQKSINYCSIIALRCLWKVFLN